MSAVLTTDDIQPVADLLDKLQSVQRAIVDLQEADKDEGSTTEYCCTITAHPYLGREMPVANTHRLSFWFVLQGLAAMERELRQKLAGMAITVQSVLPGVLRAAEEQAE